MSAFSWFGFRSSSGSEELPDIFPLSVTEVDFVAADVQNIYSRILTDVFERCQGIPEGQENLLFDNCVADESPDGLITMLAKAMLKKSELFLVFEEALSLIRKALPTEESQIREDYKTKGESDLGVYITFKNYSRTDMVRLYSALEYCTVGSLNKQMNLSKAIQLKLTDLRGSVGMTDAADVKAQAVKMAQGLRDGKDIMMDAKDIIETAKPDITSTQASMDFITEKRAFYLGMPSSWITGHVSKGGLSDTGQADAKSVERGLKNYFFSVAKPVAEALFGIKLTFKSEDFLQISSSLEAMKTFEITSDELMSQDNKRIIINKLFGLPEDSEGDPPEKPVVVPGSPNDPNLPNQGKAPASSAPPPNNAKP